MEENKLPISANNRKGWILTGVIFVLFFIIAGLPKCFSIFYMDLLEKFDSSATATGWIIGAQSLLRFGLSKYIYVVPPQSWGDRSDTKHSKCLLLGGRRLNQLTLIPKPKGSGGARAATAQVGPANKSNDTKRCLPIEASLRPGEAVPW